MQNLYNAGVSRPLQGVRVADFSHLLPGPFCARRLQALGAEIWKIELPHWPDPARGNRRLFHWLHGGQRLVRLDFRKAEGLRVLFKVLSHADILIEGFRPGLMERLGLGYPDLSRRLPGLIYCSINGRGSRGPRTAGHDLNYQGLAGVLGIPPRFPTIPAADVAAGFDAAARVAAALFKREREARGARIEVSLARAAREAGVLGLGADLGRSAAYGIYATKDGRWITLAALEPRFFEEFLRQTGRSDLAVLDPVRDAARLRRRLKSLFLQRTRAAWSRALGAKEVCLAPVLSEEEARRLLGEKTLPLGNPDRDTAAVLRACQAA